MSLGQWLFDRALSCPRTHWLWKVPRAALFMALRRLQGDVRYPVAGRSLLLPAGHFLPFAHMTFPGFSGAVGEWARRVNGPVIDVGANVGDTAAIIRAHSDAPILAIEASERYFRYLVRNAFEIGDVTPVQAFVAASRGEVVGGLRESNGTAALDPDMPGGIAVRTRHITPSDSQKSVSSLRTNQTQDDITGSTSYQDCAGTASITVTATSTITIIAKFKLRTSNSDHQAACKLVDSSDNNVGTVIAFTTNTVYQDWVIMARLTGKAAGTYTYNLMGNIANATAHCYVDEKQIMIMAVSA